MNENNNSAFSYHLTKLDLIDNSGKDWNLIPGVQSIQYFESIGNYLFSGFQDSSKMTRLILHIGS